MDGTVAMRNGRLRIDFNPDNNPIYEQIRATFRRMGEVTGKRIYFPKNPITLHTVCGARLDRDIEHGVVGADGGIYGQDGLFIADGAVFPRMPGGPPTLTIAAWAEHVGARLAACLHSGTASDQPMRHATTHRTSEQTGGGVVTPLTTSR